MINKKIETDSFLSVKELVVEYTMEGEVVHAVNGVSFHLEKGKTLALAARRIGRPGFLKKNLTAEFSAISVPIRLNSIFILQM